MGIEGIEVGTIFKMKLDEKDEVTPKGSIDYRPKFFIVVGNADYGYYVAYVLINKSINLKYNTTKELLSSQFPLRVKDYPGIFTIDPSYVNLGKIREMERGRLDKEGIYQGKLNDNDLEMILTTLRESEVITAKEKKRIGLI